MPNPYTIRPVTGADFFVPTRGGRGALAHRLLRNLCRADPLPDSVSLIGERRFGKTSLLGYLQRAAAGTPGLLVAGVDMLSLSPQSPRGFYAMVTEALAGAGALAADHPLLDYPGFRQFLYQLRAAGQRLVLFIDEFDIVARERCFDWDFFAQLRSAANTLPLALVVASVAPLREIAHAEVFGSPFFNIFQEERLGLLSEPEAEAIVTQPPGGEPGFGACAPSMIALAGRHPYFLQRVGGCAWDLREAGELELPALHDAFLGVARNQYQYIWDHSGPDEREALCALANSTRSAATGLRTLLDRGYVTGGDPPRLFGEGFGEFVRLHCPAPPAPAPAPGHGSRPAPLQPSQISPERRLALVVGINRYVHQRSGNYSLPSLRYAERDAQEIAELLAGIGYEVTRLIGGQATRAGLESAFAALEHATTADPHGDSRFVFHFSGHGQMDPQGDDTAYLVLHDTDPGDPVTGGLDMTRLVYELLPRVRVPHSLVLLDACHAGFAAGVRDLVPVDRLSRVTQQLFCGLRGRMVLAACAGEAKAREAEPLGHGIFTNYVLKHWRDLDGHHPPDRITFSSLVEYLGGAILQYHPGLPLPVSNWVGVGGTLVLRRLAPACP